MLRVAPKTSIQFHMWPHPPICPTLHLGIGQYVGPIDSSLRFWRNEVAADRSNEDEETRKFC